MGSTLRDKEYRRALDSFCDSANAVVDWSAQLLYPRRLYPSSSCVGACRHVDTDHSGSQSSRIAPSKSWGTVGQTWVEIRPWLPLLRNPSPSADPRESPTPEQGGPDDHRHRRRTE